MAGKVVRRAPDSFQEFYRVIAPMIDRTEAGDGETMRVAFDLPKEWVYLAVWLEQSRKAREAGKPVPSVPDDFELWGRLVRQVARRYMRRTLALHFEDKLERLIVGVE